MWIFIQNFYHLNELWKNSIDCDTQPSYNLNDINFDFCGVPYY